MKPGTKRLKRRVFDYELGLRLAKARKAKKLYQRQAAEALGVNEQTIAYYEQTRSDPPVNMLHRLAVLYECDINWLLEAVGLFYDKHTDEVIPLEPQKENLPRSYTPITSHRYCPKCAREVELDWDYCYYCHKKLPVKEKR